MSGHGQPGADSDDLLTPDKVAALLSVSVRSVRRYAADGYLTPVHLGRNVRYRRADVERLIASGAATSGHDIGHSRQRTADMAMSGQGQSGADVAGMSGVSAREPVEAAYRVTPAEIEQAVSRTSAQYMGDLRTMLTEVGKVYEGQLAAKDELIAELRQRAEVAESIAGAPDPRVKMLEHQVATDEIAIAELRRRAEMAEAERDRLVAAQAAPAPPHAAGGQEVAAHAPGAPAGFWGRVWRVFGGGGR